MDVLADVTTPLGAKVLRLHALRAREQLSQPFEYQLELLSEDPDIDFTQLIGQACCVEIEVLGGTRRAFNGLVTRFELAGRLGRFYRFEAVLHPWLWVLSQTHDCRIFQELTTLEIVKEVFHTHSISVVEDRTTGQYERWDYCVQYRESDLDFVSRLLEHEGIYYFFEHTAGQHTLVLADDETAHAAVPNYEKIAFVEVSGDERTDREAIRTWRVSEEMRTGKVALTDYNFEKPSVSLLTQRSSPRSHRQADHEVFDYPGGFLSSPHGEHFVQARLDETQSRYCLAHGRTDARGLQCAALFELTGFDRADQNRRYLVTRTEIEVLQNDPQSVLSSGASLTCEFEAIAAEEPFRPPRRTPKSLVKGPQTAVVVGPDGEEIFTDKYGRVKVQFHWDRYGKHDAGSSCWIRVSQAWAGKNYGFMAVPRIGQEVIVDFLEGDPDRPIITGRVYNAEQMPPWALPANATQTGLLTRSSKKGSAANANELRFEDRKGAEQVYLHAEKNQDIEVENDETHWVGHDRTKTIDNDETVYVKHDRTETVDNNESITIGNNRQEQVGVDETVQIGSNRTKKVGANDKLRVDANQVYDIGANQTESVGAHRKTQIAATDKLSVGATQDVQVASDQTFKVGASQTTEVAASQKITIGSDQAVKIGANHSTEVAGDEVRKIGKGRSTDVGKDDSHSVGKNLTIDAGDSVTITTGSASITMKKDGTIIIKGKDITIEGSGQITAKASKNVVVKGSKVLNN